MVEVTDDRKRRRTRREVSANSIESTESEEDRDERKKNVKQRVAIHFFPTWNLELRITTGIYTWHTPICAVFFQVFKFNY